MDIHRQSILLILIFTTKRAPNPNRKAHLPTIPRRTATRPPAPQRQNPLRPTRTLKHGRRLHNRPLNKQTQPHTRRPHNTPGPTRRRFLGRRSPHIPLFHLFESKIPLRLDTRPKTRPERLRGNLLAPALRSDRIRKTSPARKSRGQR